jgi:hypothetical protein
MSPDRTRQLAFDAGWTSHRESLSYDAAFAYYMSTHRHTDPRAFCHGYTAHESMSEAAAEVGVNMQYYD